LRLHFLVLHFSVYHLEKEEFDEHASCAEKKTEEVVKALKKCRKNSQSMDALRKTAFASKYDIVKPMCPCACGQGYFRILKIETSGSSSPLKNTTLPVFSPPKTVARAKMGQIRQMRLISHAM
jgi:hypothetical protein